jgi:succinyl-diaminopimelate desuccinylase
VTAPDSTGLEQLLVELCEISSFTGEERALCDHVEQRLQKLLGGAAVIRDGHSLVVTLPARVSQPRVVLAGHLDVVRTSHDGPVRIEGDKLYGPGAADMKSGLAVMLAIAQEATERETHQALTLVFYGRGRARMPSTRQRVCWRALVPLRRTMWCSMG